MSSPTGDLAVDRGRSAPAPKRLPTEHYTIGSVLATMIDRAIAAPGPRDLPQSSTTLTADSHKTLAVKNVA